MALLTPTVPPDRRSKTSLKLTPNINSGAGFAALAPGLTGNIDWGCGTLTSATATANGLVGVALGTLLARYTPTVLQVMTIGCERC